MQLSELTRPELSLVRRQRGHLPGLAPAGLLIRLETRGRPRPAQKPLHQGREWLIARLQIAAESLPSRTPLASLDGWPFAAVAAMQIVVAIQRQAHLQLAAAPCVRTLQPGSFLLYQPATQFSSQAVFPLLKLVFAALVESEPASFESRLWPQLQSALEFFQAALPGNVNTLAFLAAAQQLNVPATRIVDTLFRFGWGAQSLLMDSSLTQKTSAIGCKFARIKPLAKELLRSAGLPVAPGIPVGSIEAAWQAAQTLGLPVVVKPQSADGGVEVHVRLVTQQEVEQAAAAVIAAGHRVLVEVWKPGRDYRFQVCQGSVFRCVERTPGGVVGDGICSIVDLVEQLNRQPDRGPQGSGKRKRPIDLDLEAERTLLQQGLGFDSVPPAGHFVALRGAANVSRGGEMYEVLEHAHPDNLDLAIRAVAAMGLDLAGVDILMPDVRRSWLDEGAIICEVNAQPQMAANHSDVLQGLLKGDGRIPIDVIVGLDRLEPLLSWLGAPRQPRADLGLGLVCRAGLFVDGRCYGRAPADQFEAISTLLACTRVSRLVVATWQNSLLVDGLPFDRFDRLFSLASRDAEEPQDGQNGQALVRLLSRMARQHSAFTSDNALLDSLVGSLANREPSGQGTA